MPDALTHQRKAEHNRRAIAHLQSAGDEYLDWVVTVMFYTALHLVDQVLYHYTRANPRDHRQRHAAIASQVRLAPIYRDYREREWQSQRSRYECAPFTPAEVHALSARLDHIQQFVRSLVS